MYNIFFFLPGTLTANTINNSLVLPLIKYTYLTIDCPTTRTKVLNAYFHIKIHSLN